MQYSTIGQYIRKRRIQTGKGLNTFAFDCDVDPATLSNFELGKSDIYFGNFIKIANGFDITPSQLLSDFENNIEKPQ